MQDPSDILTYIRRESLDVYNRLHSIAEDVEFVNLVHEAYPNLPLLPNLRCGAWYTDPKIASNIPAYFKSTDGHFGNWSFNLRRPNLHLIPLLIEMEGLVLVDSTRSGKRMPDALSKTVPIWCAVINRTVAKLYQLPQNEYDCNLYTPPQVVSAQEHAQIETRIEVWADSLARSSYELPRLPRPLRPLWITPSTTRFPSITESFVPVICVSSSKQVQDGLERRNNGYAYVQGSGDDHELWGMGLTSTIFWDYRDELLQASRQALNDTVESILSRCHTAVKPSGWITLPTPVLQSNGKILICSNVDLPSPPISLLPNDPSNSPPIAFVEITARPVAPPLNAAGQLGPPSLGDHIAIEAPEGKKGQLAFLQSVLPKAIPFISDKLRTGSRICISCDTGKDLSVGVALVALQKFFDHKGSFQEICEESNMHPTKESIKTRLQWIISSRPQANPSRATLKRVNEYLLTPELYDRAARTYV